MSGILRSLVVPSVIAVISVTQIGCTNQTANSSATEQEQTACRAFGPRTLSGALTGEASGAASVSKSDLNTLISGGKASLMQLGINKGFGLVSGYFVGHHMDSQDCIEAQMALGQITGTKVGQSVTWENAGTGSHGSYTALTKERKNPSTGQVCLRVRQVSTIKGHESTSEIELTCRDENGNYSTVEGIQK